VFADSWLGPIVGGGFADSSATWRWAFYLNLVLFAACSPVFFFVLESFNPQPEKTFIQKIKSLDWAGTILNAGTFVSFVMLFTFAGSTWSWNDGRIIALFVVFGVCLVLLVFQQTFCFFTSSEMRIFPVDFLRNKDLVLSFIATSSGANALALPIWYIPLYFSFARGLVKISPMLFV